MFKSIRQHIQSFRKEIRRDSLEQYKKKRRESFIKTLGRQELIAALQPHAEEEMICDLADVFKHCRKALLRPIPQSMQEEAAVMGINLHISLLREVCADIEDNQGPTGYEAALLKFVTSIMHKFIPEQLSKQPEYATEFYRLMGLLFHRFLEKDGQQLLEWVSDCDSLWLVGRALIFAQAVNCDTYPNLFSMIKQGLASSKQEIRLDALRVLLKIVEYCDQQDLENINERHPSIPRAIINLLSENVKLKFALIEYWAPLLYLFIVSEEFLVQHAKSGIIATCGQMIDTGIESNIYGGLQLLLLFCKMKKLIDFLLLDEDLEDSKMWLTSCLRIDAYKHPNATIRKAFAKLVRGVMRACHQQQLQSLCQKFVMKEHSLLIWMEWSLGQEAESEVKIMVLECASRLLFEVGPEVDKEGDYLKVIVAQLHYNGIIRHVTALQQHPQEQLRQRSSDLLDRIAYIQSTSGEMEI